MTFSEFMNTQEGQEGLDPDFVKRLRESGVHTRYGLASPNKTRSRKKWPSLLRYGSGGNGDPGITRTCDLRFRKPSLYPAELRDRETRKANRG